ncbi:MAG: esterase-like activity of phytase family protein [Rhodobacter sp.]|uniref:esterase-like activity of phytase family protein n=1 Tax=Pararhodobacter sp. TaxID=2127056 RepID=UPI001D4D9E9B|nr:esterase-like activity of phytase family protein [Pararhodobacter sp.]MCB1344988.1 esterase-like activity of phytase family protein [Paracoccaceae bacterium]MCC0072191.1 esterase-like activity of phytase family protein [Rhodobacter sp.]HPD92881.1 esterase-like activity of phytase family protein [Pararhodobacter sp.]
MISTHRFFALLLTALLLPLAAQAQPDTYYAGVVQHPTTQIPPVQVVARYALPRMSGGINDFSGIATTDGVNVLLLSDHGFVVSGRLERGYGQRIDGFQVRQVANLLDEQGRPLTGSLHDSEGIAIGPDGALYVSFEQHNRVLRYDRLGAPAQAMGEHRDFDRMRAGRGMEALAIDRDGSIYAIPERAARATYGFPSYRWRAAEGWTGSFRMPSDGAFLPVGADFGPDGRLYVLEREQTGQGFRSQVRRFVVRGRAIGPEDDVIMRSDYGQFGDLEGLSVFRDWSGRIRLLMVSDDDQGRYGASEIVDLVVNR